MASFQTEFGLLRPTLGGKTQLPRSHYPTVCREGSYLIVSGLSLGPPNLVMAERAGFFLVIELENSAEPSAFLHRACSVAIASRTTGVHIKRNTRAEFAKLGHSLLLACCEHEA